jgi:hypothetical protein
MSGPQYAPRGRPRAVSGVAARLLYSDGEKSSTISLDNFLSSIRLIFSCRQFLHCMRKSSARMAGSQRPE